MSSLEQQPAGDGQGAQRDLTELLRAQVSGAFYQSTDWLSFGGTAAIALAVYWYTLAPEVTLEMSGLLATDAKYAGVAHPPGFPVWTMYAWLFTKLVPWSNIAWRVAVSSAVAGAISCGVIALIVSRVGALVLDGMPGFRRLAVRDERLLRLVAGSVAGLGFGFSDPFWGMAVVVDTRALSIAFFSITLSLLVRWLHDPTGLKRLYTAFLVYGLTVSASQVLIPAALGLPFFATFGDRKLGRELFFAAAILAECVLVAHHFGWFPQLDGPGGKMNAVGRLYLYIGLLCAAVCLGLVFNTGGGFSRVRPALIAGMFALIGTLPHLQLPLASMSNPPSNWGYARTVEGFVHLITRGQFGRLSPTQDVSSFLQQLVIYAWFVCRRLGVTYLIVATLPFCFLPRMRPQAQGAILGLLAFYLCMSLLMLYLMNPPNNRSAWGLFELFLSPSYLILALWAGLGLILLGTLVCRPRNPRLTG